jgi:lipopolysaccharide/colanic/teichoic acid biosynthesis glycosyltransferase
MEPNGREQTGMMAENGAPFAYAGSAEAVAVPRGWGYRAAKRTFDMLFALTGGILLSPVILAVALAVRLDSPGPAFYSQVRIGKNGKPFRIYKFRSMRQDADQLLASLSGDLLKEYQENYKLKEDFRITRVGKFIRKTNLDELPQLINILAGQLSFVGPRPVLDKEAEKYGAYRDLFLSVRPGLTGYWQANRKSDTSYEERIDMELHYVQHCSVGMDLKILWQTFMLFFR